MAHQLYHGRAFVFARTDWEYVLNTFVFGMAVGYHFVSSDAGSCNGMLSGALEGLRRDLPDPLPLAGRHPPISGNFLGIGADMTGNASVLVEAADPWGILYVSPAVTRVGPSAHATHVSRIANGEFTSFIDPAWGKEVASPSQIVVAASNHGSLQISNCPTLACLTRVRVRASRSPRAPRSCILGPVHVRGSHIGQRQRLVRRLHFLRLGCDGVGPGGARGARHIRFVCRAHKQPQE